MQPSKCDHCGGTNLHHAALTTGFFRWPVAIGGHFGGLYLQAAACLDCGAVGTYLDPATLQGLRRKNGRPMS